MSKELISAARIGNIVVVSALIKQNNINLDARDDWGKTAMHYAAELGHAHVLSALITAGANREVADREGQRPIHLATGHVTIECLCVLSKAGVNVNVSDLRGWTPLHIAALNGCFKSRFGTEFNEGINNLKMLLEMGADKEAKTSDGKTAIDIARGEYPVKDLKPTIDVLLNYIPKFRSNNNSSSSLTSSATSSFASTAAFASTATASTASTVCTTPMVLTDSDKPKEFLPQFVNSSAKSMEDEMPRLPKRRNMANTVSTANVSSIGTAALTATAVPSNSTAATASAAPSPYYAVTTIPKITSTQKLPTAAYSK